MRGKGSQARALGAPASDEGPAKETEEGEKPNRKTERKAEINQRKPGQGLRPACQVFSTASPAPPPPGTLAVSLHFPPVWETSSHLTPSQLPLLPATFPRILQVSEYMPALPCSSLPGNSYLTGIGISIPLPVTLSPWRAGTLSVHLCNLRRSMKYPSNTQDPQVSKVFPP